MAVCLTALDFGGALPLSGAVLMRISFCTIAPSGFRALCLPRKKAKGVVEMARVTLVNNVVTPNF